MFRILHQILNILKKKIILIGYVFTTLRTQKHREMSKKSLLRRPYNKQHEKRSQTLLNYERHHFYYIFSPIKKKMSLKMSLLLTCKILGLFVNTFTDDDKYSAPNSDSLIEPIQMELSKKQKTVSHLFSQFRESILNFEQFGKKE